jgi:hypothetical protein
MPGKAEMIRDTPDGDWLLSFVEYGMIRWLLLGWRARRIIGFLPRYELIVTRWSILDPACIFRFTDIRAYDWIAAAIIQGGVYDKPLAKLMQKYPDRIYGNWEPSGRPMLEKDPIEITPEEETEYARRLDEYRNRVE